VTLATGGHYPHILNSPAYESLLLQILNNPIDGDKP
jgi:hypothetical protein